MPQYVDPINQIRKNSELRLYPEPPYTIEEILELSTQYYRSIKGNNYLLTFTKRSEVKPSDWFDAIIKQLKKKFIIKFLIGFEHLDANMHAHAYIECNKYVQKREFALYERDIGYIDLRIVRKDNGVEGYISKENPIYENVLDLKENKKIILNNYNGSNQDN